MKSYRLKRPIEAMRWTDTDADREAFADWFDHHGLLFETRGPIAILPDVRLSLEDRDDDPYRADPGDWVVWTDGEFVAMDDAVFRGTYEEVP